MPATLNELLLKTRKSATASFGPKEWKMVLEALGLEVVLGKDRNTVVEFTVNAKNGSFSITKEPRYRHITFYKLREELEKLGVNLVVDSCKVLGMDDVAAEKHKKKIENGAGDLHRTGTCQCCFNPQKVSKGNGKLMALHGYQRPGYGYIVGDCLGQGEQPFEVSCELTKRMRSGLQDAKLREEKWLAKLNADEVATLDTLIPTKDKEPDRYGYPRTKKVSVQVVRGAMDVQNPHFPEAPWERIPSFEQVREQEIRMATGKIRQMTTHIDFLTEKIETWVQVWAE